MANVVYEPDMPFHVEDGWKERNFFGEEVGPIMWNFHSRHATRDEAIVEANGQGMFKRFVRVVEVTDE